VVKVGSVSRRRMQSGRDLEVAHGPFVMPHQSPPSSLRDGSLRNGTPPHMLPIALPAARFLTSLQPRLPVCHCLSSSAPVVPTSNLSHSIH
jgi:hypothetical protein